MTPRDAIERAARESRARLVAFLARQTRDIAAAEDALADAFAAALTAWPRDGVPSRPEAWLLTVARRRALDAARHSQVRDAAAATLALAAEEAGELAEAADPFPDERLRLMFVCAHPALDRAIRPALMLQTVLGLDAARIAGAFLVSPAAMGQRLARAKAKIRDAGIGFSVPEKSELPARLDAVLDAIYAAFGIGWDSVGADPVRGHTLASEATRLGRLLAELLPAAEARGLLALMLHVAARTGPPGPFVPLDAQDPGQWDAAMIAEADAELGAAGEANALGRFQIEAAIQSVHAARRLTGKTDWAAIVLLYEALLRLAPSIGARVAHAGAVARHHDAPAGLALLATIAPGDVAQYQPFWAVRAALLAESGDAEAAGTAYQRAIGLCRDPAVRDYLVDRAAAVDSDIS